MARIVLFGHAFNNLCDALEYDGPELALCKCLIFWDKESIRTYMGNLTDADQWDQLDDDFRYTAQPVYAFGCEGLAVYDMSNWDDCNADDEWFDDNCIEIRISKTPHYTWTESPWDLARRTMR